MEVTTIFLLCLIIVLLFSIYGKISKDAPKKEELVAGIASPKELDIYRQGIQQGWMHVNVSLYKMWNELDILDFENIQSKLQQTLEILASNPDELMKWHKKLNEYLKAQGNDNKS